ncbi:MAG: polysaccharide biosynthesis C-terminal domain-containing protein [Candidatus Acidiferrum sp.]
MPDRQSNDAPVLGDTQENRSSTVAKNFVWASLELLLGLFASLYTTVAVARTFGPTLLGYFNYIYWLTSISAQVGSLGLPLTTLKYMGEYLGAGKLGLARSTFIYTLKLQAILSFGVALLGIPLVWHLVPPEYQVISVVLVLGVVPQMVILIPSMANTAFQDLRANAHGGFVGVLVNVVVIALTLHFGWGLLGVAFGTLFSRCAELLIKMVPILPWLKRTISVSLPKELRRGMLSFSGKGTALMLLSIVIWDRSDMVLLKWLQSDIRQLAFFSVSFSLLERLMILPQAFGRSLNATQMVESGRDPQRLLRLTATAARYTLLGSLPLFLGSACLSGPIIRIIYGWQYLPAISVFGLAALFAVSKPMLFPAETLLYASNDLGFLLKWSCFCAAVEIGIDMALIPHYAAIGAAIGNGAAQTLAAVGIWTWASLKLQVPLEFGRLGKVVGSAVIMAAAVLACTMHINSPVIKLIVGFVVGVAAYATSLRLMSTLDEDDRNRLLHVARRLPSPLQRSAQQILNFVTLPSPLR